MANVTKRTNQAGEVSFKFQVLLGRDMDGKQITKSMTWKPPAGMKPTAAEKEAQKQAVLFEEKVKSGAITIDGSMKFAEYAAVWLENAEIRPITRAQYVKVLKVINQAIGHIPLEKLRPEHLQQLYKNMREDGVKRNPPSTPVTFGQKIRASNITMRELSELSGVEVWCLNAAARGDNILHYSAKAICKALESKGMDTKGMFIFKQDATKLAPNTVKRYHAIIGAILKSAKKSRILPHSITEYMTPPKGEQPEVRFLNDEQAREYLLALMNEPDIRIRTAFMLLMFTGIRRGELCGLEWRDIDYLDGSINIQRSSIVVPGQGICETPPKTKGSIRSIAVDPFLLQVLSEYRKWQNEHAAKMGDAWKNEKQRLFTNDNGSPIHPNSISNWCRSFHNSSGLPYLNAHAYRHTFITLQIAAGTDIKTIQSMSGHSSAAVLLDVYGHAIKSAQEKAAAALGNILLPAPNEVIMLPETT